MTPALDRLFDTPGNFQPPGAVVTVLTTRDGVSLRFAHWIARGRTHGTVCILPGRSEFIEKYFETITELLDRGFCVGILDWRGQGGSSRQLRDRRKGHIDHFSLYRRDIDAMLAHIAPIMPAPFFALAHSMGGAIICDAIARGESRFVRAVLSAPMIGFRRAGWRDPAAKAVRALNLVGLGGIYLPGGHKHAPSLFAPFAGNVLTSDPARYDRNASILIAQPDLGVGSPTIGWTAAAFRLMRTMDRAEYGLKAARPILMICAGDESVVSTPAAEELAMRLRGAAAVVIGGAKHELLMERDQFRAQFWRAFDAFIPGEPLPEPLHGQATASG